MEENREREESQQEPGVIDSQSLMPVKNDPVEEKVKPWRLYITGIVTGLLLATLVMFIGDFFNWHPFSFTPAADKAYELNKVLERYIDNYYWKSDTSVEEFANMAGKGLVSALGDPYSVYMTNDELTKIREKNDGDYIGIGAAVAENTESGRKYVTRIESGWPADKAGMKVGDEIIALNGESVSSMSVDDMVKLIRAGKEGTKLVFTVIRRDNVPADVASGSSSESEKDGKKLELTVVTETIVNQSIESKMLEDKIGYIRISTFDRETPIQFRKAVLELTNDGVESLIFDVRNNGGGVLTSVVAMLNRLLPEGTILTETRKGQKDTIYKSDSKESLDIPMAVIINGMSASASEVFAGALQDREKASLVGETSYGKGVVQSIYTLPDEGGGIKLTTGEYLLPSGRSIHEKGLTPDKEVVYSGTEEEMGTDKDNQLRAAIELLK